MSTVPESATVRDLVAKTCNPGAFADDPTERHYHCSPYTFASRQEIAFEMADRILAALAPFLARESDTQALDDAALLKFIRERCNVIYWPENSVYPIEHTLAAHKNMWPFLMLAHESELAALRPQSDAAGKREGGT